MQVMDQIEGCNGQLLPWEGGNFSPTAKSQLGIFRRYILKLLERDPSLRPSMAQFCDMCSRILTATTTLET